MIGDAPTLRSSVPGTGRRTHATHVLVAFVGLALAACTASPTNADRDVASVSVVPPTATVAVGRSVALTAVARDDSGAVLTGKQVVWRSADPNLATVSTSGTVIGIDQGGPVSIAATVEGVSGSAAVTVTAEPAPSLYSFPLSVDSTGRHLVDRNGRPFLLVGDAPWSLVAQLSSEEVDRYLASRQQLGFDLVMVNLLEHYFATNAPSNIYDEPPFTGEPFTTPNEAYFARVDQAVRSAAERGIVVLLDPLYLGYKCGREGWCAEVRQASDTQLAWWGRYVGNRYKDFDNIMWLVGGDTDPSPVRDKVRRFAEAVHAADPRHLITAHNARGQMAVTPWPDEPWLTVNDIYEHTDSVYSSALAAYHIAPPMPYFLVEADYENAGQTTARTLRSQSYTTVLSGGFGHILGNCPIWGFDAPTMPTDCRASGWESQLLSPGALNMLYFERLFTSRHWDLLVPDEDHHAISSGYGTAGQPDFVPAAYASDGSSIIAYLPSARQVTVDGTVLSGSGMNVWWYDPANGVASSGGALPTTSPQRLEPPGPGDWVLVVDSPNFTFTAPGGGQG